MILVAEHDLQSLSGMADEFHRAIFREQGKSRLLTVAERNHNSLLFSAVATEDPAARAILEFVRRYNPK